MTLHIRIDELKLLNASRTLDEDGPTRDETSAVLRGLTVEASEAGLTDRDLVAHVLGITDRLLSHVFEAWNMVPWNSPSVELRADAQESTTEEDRQADFEFSEEEERRLGNLEGDLLRPDAPKNGDEKSEVPDSSDSAPADTPSLKISERTSPAKRKQSPASPPSQQTVKEWKQDHHLGRVGYRALAKKRPYACADGLKRWFKAEEIERWCERRVEPEAPELAPELAGVSSA